MKKFKKLIPSLCALLVSAVMLGGTTFAWFAMNDTVKTNGMSVVTKSNTKFIVTVDDVANIYKTDASGVTTTITAKKTNGGIKEGDSATNNVYPVRYNSKAEVLAVTTSDGSKNVASGKWFTAHSTSLSDGNSEVNKITEIEGSYKPTSGADEGKTYLDEYALLYTSYVGLAGGSDDLSGKLKISATFTKSTTDSGAASGALCALVVVKQISVTDSTEQKLAFDNISDKNEKTTGSAISLSGSTKYAQIDVYVYYDGGHGDIVSINSGVAVSTLEGCVTLTIIMEGVQ